MQKCRINNLNGIIFGAENNQATNMMVGENFNNLWTIRNPLYYISCAILIVTRFKTTFTFYFIVWIILILWLLRLFLSIFQTFHWHFFLLCEQVDICKDNGIFHVIFYQHEGKGHWGDVNALLISYWQTDCDI